MKIFKFSIVLIVGLFLVGCSEDLPIQNDNQPKEKVGSDTYIPLEEALQYADELFSTLSGNTRASSRTVASVECIKSPNTRSSQGGDTIYYIVNYQNEKGFAVLSANKNLGYVYAIGEEGHLSLEDTVENKGVAKFFRKLNEYSYTPTPNPIDSTYIRFPYDSINPANFPAEEMMSPLLPKNLQRWPGTSGGEMSKRHKSVETAIGMIMAYFEKPNIWESFKNPSVSTNLDYSLIKSYNLWGKSVKETDAGFKEIDKFLSLVKDSFFDVDLFYDYDNNCEYEFIFFHPCLKQLGDHFGYDIFQYYSEPGNINHEHQEPMTAGSELWRRSLKEGYLILSGNITDNYTSCAELYLWVVDGYITFEKNRNTFLNKYDSDTLFHCVWAKGGACNGYYTFQSDGEDFIDTPISLDTSLPGNVPSDFTFVSYYGFRPNNK